MRTPTGQLRFLSQKLRRRYVWRRVFLERLTEPLHLNAISVLMWMFGSFRAKVAFDLVLRHHHAYGILAAADQARELGIKRLTLVEFGVAVGTGLLNMCEVAAKVTEATGVEFTIYGFDTGRGMPPPRSYRDHPEMYQAGDFVMDPERLRHTLPANAELVLGELADTVPAWVDAQDGTSPVGFVSLDVDYYWSSKDALQLLTGPPELYLPRTHVYLDDIEEAPHNSWCGERLAVREFNEENELRKIEHHPFLRTTRVFQRPPWIGRMSTLHVLDHPIRSSLTQDRESLSLLNPYLNDAR